MYLVFIILGALLLLLLGVCFAFSNIAIHPKTFSHDEQLEKECKSGKIDKEVLNSKKKEIVTINSPYGYKLYGWFFPNEVADGKLSNKTVIICHGIYINLYCSVKFMDMFMKRGFNVLLYDHRYHGKSGGGSCTYGYFEKYDLKAWTDWVYERVGEETIVGTMGESMGGATVLQNTAIDKRVAFCISDCAFSDLYKLLKVLCERDYHMPMFLVKGLSNLFVRIRVGMSLWDVSPIRDIANVEAPIFFTHGDNDTFVPTHMCRDMYEAKKKGIKKLYIAPNSGHAEAYWNNREEYERQVDEFLNEIGIK